MKRGQFAFVREIIEDYPYIDKYIEKIEEEYRHPYIEDDINSGIKKTGGLPNNKQENLLITIESDDNLRKLKKNKRVIKECFDGSSKETQYIIRELYFKKRPSLTMIGAAEQLHINKNKAYDLRNDFFEEVWRYYRF